MKFIKTLHITFVLIFALYPIRAFADCPIIPNGTTILTPETRPEGAIFYNADHQYFQGCVGTEWRILNVSSINGIGQVGCIAPPSCPNVGDVCSDGSLFAGFMVYGSSCEALFVTDNNQSSSSNWKNTSGTNDISVDSWVDGKINSANRGGAIANFPAFDVCESNTYHSKSDWYLPSYYEMHLLLLNRAAIDANAAGSLALTGYWTSTEWSSGNGYRIFRDTNNITGSFFGKVNAFNIRCIRRD